MTTQPAAPQTPNAPMRTVTKIDIGFDVTSGYAHVQALAALRRVDQTPRPKPCENLSPRSGLTCHKGVESYAKAWCLLVEHRESSTQAEGLLPGGTQHLSSTGRWQAGLSLRFSPEKVCFVRKPVAGARDPKCWGGR